MLANELVLSELGGKTASAALKAGMEPRQIWTAICSKQDVPLERRWGRDVRP